MNTTAMTIPADISFGEHAYEFLSELAVVYDMILSESAVVYDFLSVVNVN